MENTDFAGIFEKIAELLELEEENRFRIRAYQKAAQNIEDLSESVESIYNKGGIKALENIPGIGKGIAEKIEELIKTGKSASYRQLLKKYPPGLLDVIQVQGVGPKKALLFFKKLKIDSIDKLESAAKKGLLEKLPKIRAKTAENILKGIELKRKSKGRFNLHVASTYADLLVRELKTLKEVDQIIPCGSLRRMQETIGDIDILVTSKNPVVIMDRFVKLPQVDRVLAKGETKSSVILKNGMQADVRVVEPKSFGAAVHHFTGSKDHNIQTRELGIKKGLKINEYGIFKGNKLVGGAKEDDVFKALGLPYIPPELRQGTGEIEAAGKGKLPKLVELKDIKGDLHIHTIATDGSNTIEEIAEAAKRLGYEYIAITDHTKSTRVAGGLSEKEALAHLKRIDKSNKNISGIKIIRGMEVDILPDGTLDYPDSLLKEIDIVFASIHSNFKMDGPSMTKRVVRAIKNKYVSVFAHPTGRLIGEREGYHIDLEEIIRIAGDTGTSIELNASPLRLDLDHTHCRIAKQLGVLIVIVTDAHSIEHLNYMKYGVATARRGWLEPKDVLNTLPYPQLMKNVQQKRR